MNTWKVILATLVIFAAGVVTGGLLVTHADRVKLRSRPNWRQLPAETSPRPVEPGAPRETIRPPGAPAAVPQFLRKEFLERLDREVNLTADQRERIERVIREGQERNRQFWDRVSPELRKEVAEARRQIQAVLLPEQRARFEELMKQRPQRRQEDSNLPDRFRPRDPQYPALREGPPPEDPPPPHPDQPR